jgi:hypothetical protein
MKAETGGAYDIIIIIIIIIIININTIIIVEYSKTQI